jgi:hypothetical protein
MAKYDGWFLYFGTKWGVLKWDYNANRYGGLTYDRVVNNVSVGFWTDDHIEAGLFAGTVVLHPPKSFFIKRYFGL